MWQEGDRVQVSLPYGTDGKTVHLGRIKHIQEPGPNQYNPQRTHKVVFDDQMVFGGLGMGWFNPSVLAAEGEEPAEPERIIEPTNLLPDGGE